MHGLSTIVPHFFAIVLIAMDPLSDVLSLLKPRSYLTAGLDVGGQWAIRFTGRMGTIKCYAVMEGACWLKVDGVADPVQLAAGDGFMLPNGCSFTLASDLTLTPTPAGDVLAGARHGAVVVHGGGGKAMLAGNRFEVTCARRKRCSRRWRRSSTSGWRRIKRRCAGRSSE